MQSRTGSAVEAVVNVVAGLGVSLALTWWLTGAPLRTAAGWSVWFTVASLVRSYALRRVFAGWERGRR
jgi:hypothetical protein